MGFPSGCAGERWLVVLLAANFLPPPIKSPGHSRITIVVGDLWQPDLKSYSQTGKDLYQALADEVMHRIAALNL